MALGGKRASETNKHQCPVLLQGVAYSSMTQSGEKTLCAVSETYFTVSFDFMDLCSSCPLQYMQTKLIAIALVWAKFSLGNFWEILSYVMFLSRVFGNITGVNRRITSYYAVGMKDTIHSSKVFSISQISKRDPNNRYEEQKRY